MTITETGPGTRAILYARVSTDRQAERYGLDAQQRMLLERARARGYAIVPDGPAEVFCDDESGGTLNRPAWRRAEQAVEQGLADLLLTLDPDRLSRDLADMLAVERQLQLRGVRLEFLTQDVDPSPLGRAFFQIRGVFAELERNTIRERTARGRREKARQGKIVNPGTLPTWLRSEDRGETVRLDDHWADIVRMIFRLFVEDGLTLRAICGRLHDLGIVTPSGRGTHWQPTTIQGWLRKPAAKGTFYQLVTKSVLPAKPRKQSGHLHPSTHRRDESQGVAMAVPALVSEAVWEAAQRRLRQNQALSSRNAKRPYLLRGLLVCGGCGSRMAGQYRSEIKDPEKARYYRCGRGHARRRVDGTAACSQPVYRRAAQLEAEVWDTIAGLLRNPENLRTELARRREAGSPTHEALQAELVTAQRRLQEIPAEMDRLVDGYGKGLIPDDRMKARMDQLREERARLDALAAERTGELHRLQADADEEEAAVRFAARVATGLDALDDAGRQELLRLVVREVVVHKDRVIIRTVLPTADPSGGGSGGAPAPGRLCTGALVAVGRADPGGHAFPGADCAATEFGVGGGHAEHGLHG